MGTIRIMEQTFRYTADAQQYPPYAEHPAPARRPPSLSPAKPEQRGLSFRSYVMTRSWGYGRGSQESWTFISLARGDAEFPDVTTLAELRAYLRRRELAPELVTAAERVWRSYQSQRERSLKR
jgi:hypothetical protein